MKQLIELFGKPSRIVIGLMSGTSVDGIDAALVRIGGNGTNMELSRLDFLTLPFPPGFKELVLKNSRSGTGDVADIARLNFLIAGFYADAVEALCRHAGITRDEVDLIGSHGQTIHHLPEQYDMFGKKVRATLQIGDPSVLAKLTGIVTVGDFRVGDVALGGQGAPLVPYFDYLLFRSDTVSRVLLNIGGIANITYLPKRCPPENVIAFDTGPGNMLIDQAMKRLLGKEFDENGDVAKAGCVQEDMLKYLMEDDFVNAPPPKSTGRERYGESFLIDLLQEYPERKPEDLIATLSEYTAASVHENVLRFLKQEGMPGELLVSGGGAHNDYVMNSLRELFSDVDVKAIEGDGMSADAKEAICFAVLANETISGNCTNLPSVTGARRPTILGKICLP